MLSLPLTSSELLPKLLSALYSGLSLEDLSQLFFLFFHVLFLCAIFFRLYNGLKVKKKKKIKAPRRHSQDTAWHKSHMTSDNPYLPLYLIANFKVETFFSHPAAKLVKRVKSLTVPAARHSHHLII